MKRIISFILLLVMVSASAFAQEVATTQDSKQAAKQERKAAVKSHLKQHFKLYGFVRNYFAYDSRESISGTADLYNYQPKDENWNQTPEQAATSGVEREDLNAVSTFRFLSLTTRLGVNIMDYKWRGTEFGGKIEADFYAGLSTKGTGTHSLSGVAQLRLRQAYLTLAWDSLAINNNKDYARVELAIGQTWHPMAADLCDVIALNSGAPFGPFNRSPQVKMDARLGKYVTLTGSLLWQMQYLSTGPDGQSAEYIAYSKTPEAYLGLSVHDKGWLFRAGVDVLSISPRHLGSVLAADGVTSVKVKVSDRLTTASPFLYLQYKKGEFSLKAKTIFAESGEHMNMNGGYGVKAVRADGTWEYTPTRNSTSWISLVYGGKVGQQEDKHPQKLQGILFAGYIRNFGTKEALIDADLDGKLDYYFPRANNMNRMWRLSPTLLYTVGKFQLGLEYEITSVQYGKSGALNAHGLADTHLHWVTNHRVQLMTKFNF
ncbi:MAG: hypothetical protein J6P74_00185 [Paludibacteraceae bacterium]|nr:hypothetical protein [Paludibacteraceae bacterium]